MLMYRRGVPPAPQEYLVEESSTPAPDKTLIFFSIGRYLYLQYLKYL